MRYGRLDRLIDIQRKSVTLSASGQPIETWENIASRRAASVSPVSGDETFAPPQIGAEQVTEFQVRWAPSIAALTPLDRIVYPAVPQTSPPATTPGTSVYDILAVHEVGRARGLRIIARRRNDV